MVFEFRHFITILPDTFQSGTIRRMSRRIRKEMMRDTKLMEKLAGAEKKGAIKNVETLIEKAVKEQVQELKQLLKVGRQTEILELHETQRLGQLNKELARIGGKAGIDKVRGLVDSVNNMITRLKDLEQLQMAKFDKLRSGGDVWVRAVWMDEGSIINEMMSIGTVETRLIRKIRSVENKAQGIAQKIETEQKAEKLESEFKALQSDIDELGQMIEKEVKYFDEEVKDETIMMVILRDHMKKLEAKVRKYVEEGYPKPLAEELIGKVENAFSAELGDMTELVADYRFAISQAYPQYRKAA